MQFTPVNSSDAKKAMPYFSLRGSALVITTIMTITRIDEPMLVKMHDAFVTLVVQISRKYLINFLRYILSDIQLPILCVVEWSYPVDRGEARPSACLFPQGVG